MRSTLDGGVWRAHFLRSAAPSAIPPGLPTNSAAEQKSLKICSEYAEFPSDTGSDCFFNFGRANVLGPATFQHKVLRRYVGGFAWPTIALAVGTWTVFLLALFALNQDWISGWAMVAIAVICNFYSFTVLHEAVHENIEGKSRGGWLTEALGWSSGAMFMAPFQAFRLIHLTHHQNTNTPDLDPD